MTVNKLFLRINFALILFVFFSQLSFAQSYNTLVRKADSLYRAKNYKVSYETYQRAFQLEKKNSFDLYNAACSAALAGENKTAFEYLELASQNGWTNVAHMKQDTDLESLHADKKWSELVDKMQHKADAIESSYDKPLQKELLAILSDDQTIRNQFVSTANKLGYKNPTVDSLGKVMRYKDSLNLIKITKILDEKGWVGKDKVGEAASQTLFLVIQHSDLKSQEKYLPMMREAVKKGDALPRDLALLEDRIALRNGRRQTYGSQIHRDDKANKFYVAPLEDPDNVDRRRAEVGLNSMAEYVRQWNITWNVDEYKKQLPELEALSKQVYGGGKK